MKISADRLRLQAQLILAAWGMPKGYIDHTVSAMIDTDLHGIDSHGIGMLSGYNDWRKTGGIVFDGPITVVSDLPALALVDGGRGLGHPVGTFSMALAIDKAKETGVGAVTVRASNHFGAAGYYARMALEHNLIGIALTGTPGAAVVPTFGKQNMLGTNPIAFAAPTRRNPPFVLDMATSTVAIGKLSVAKRLGLPLPNGWAFDESGNPTNDADTGRAACRLTPLGGSRDLGSHKGYGLGMMVDILSSTLSGADIFCVSREEGSNFVIGNVGHFFMALDPQALRGDRDFQDELDDLIDIMRATPPVEGGKPVLIAGDPEWEAFEARSSDGIPVSEQLMAEIMEVAAEVDAEFVLGC